MSWLAKLRKIMGRIADLVIKGREAGLYNEKNGPGGPTR